MVDLSELEGTLDLWLSRWQPEEQEVFANAIERILLVDAPHPTQLAALAACHAIGGARLLEAATAAVASGHFSRNELGDVAARAVPLRRALEHAAQLTGDGASVQLLLARTLRSPHEALAGEVLDRIDIRDLYAAWQSAPDATLRGEAARRLLRRGRHQRSRLGRSLGLPLGDLDAALAPDARAGERVAALLRAAAPPPRGDALAGVLDDGYAEYQVEETAPEPIATDAASAEGPATEESEPYDDYRVGA